MKPIVVFSFCFFLSLSLAGAQATPQTTPATTQSTDRVQIEAALQRYIAAYAHRSSPELLAVWPGLESQKKEKEYEKINHHFADASVSDEQMTVQLLDIQATNDGAIVRAQRTEQFVKTQKASSIVHGDLNMGNMPVQDPGPAQTSSKKDVKKSDQVWITMKRAGDVWTIASISDKKP